MNQGVKCLLIYTCMSVPIPKNSHLKLEEIVELAKKRGLGAVCITDHDDMGLKEYAVGIFRKDWISNLCRN